MKDPDAETRERIDDLRAELARKDEEIAGLRESVNRYDESVTRLAVESGKKDQRIRELEAAGPEFNRNAIADTGDYSATCSVCQLETDDEHTWEQCARHSAGQALKELDAHIASLAEQETANERIRELEARELELMGALEASGTNLARAVEALETVVPITEAEIGHHAPIGLGEEVCKAWQERWKKLVDARTVLQALKGGSGG